MRDNMKLGGHLVFWATLIIIFLIMSCSPIPKVSALNPEGDIIRQDGDRVLGIFEDLGDKPYTYYYQWFYFPGKGLVSSETHYLRIELVERSKDEN